MRYACAAVVVAIAAVASGWATEAQAAPTGPGGYIYWSKMVGTAGTNMRDEIWRLTVNTSWTAVGTPVCVDCVPFSNVNTKSWSVSTYGGNSLEILDPRAQGGTGSIVLPVIYNPSWGGKVGTAVDQGWDIVSDNVVTGTKAVISDGTLWTTAAATSTVGLNHVMTAPANWVSGTTSNGLSLVTSTVVGGYYYGAINYLHDTNINHAIDNTTAEGNVVKSFALNSPDPDRSAYTVVGDMEFAGKVLYASTSATNSTGFERLYRYWQDGAGVTHSTLFAQGSHTGYQSTPICGNLVGSTTGAGVYTNTYGVAVNTHTASPIVYWFAYDNVSNGSGGYVQNTAIFALRDTDGDNVADSIAEVWRNGTLGINCTATPQYGSGDIEFYTNPKDGSTYLVCEGLMADLSTTQTFLLQLADNGLVATGGSVISSNASALAGFGIFGFEMDMNPTSVPEPMTALLLGSGALGLVGYIRRQRMR